MKSALVLEKDVASCVKLSKVLKWLGYVTAPAHTPDAALKAARTINFDVIVTHTTKNPNDRRSLTGELKRLAPQAAIVVIADNENGTDVRTWRYQGDTAVIKRPASVEAMRRIVEFGIDGHGLQPSIIPASQERRRKH